MVGHLIDRHLRLVVLEAKRTAANLDAQEGPAALRAGVSLQRLYTVTVMLKDRFDEPEEISRELSGRLGPFEVVSIDTRRASTRVVFAIEAVDLWQAVLHALGLVSGIGCSPVSLAADLAA